MTNDHDHPEHAQENGQPMNIAALLRAAADGELTECQCQALEAHCAQCDDAECQIAFEKALRACCGRVMSTPCCPDALRAKIVAMTSDGAKAPLVAQDDEALARRIAESNQRTRSRRFWARSPMMSAAAALLILTAGALVWQSASLANRNTPTHFTPTQASYFSRVSDFAIREHTRCCDDTIAQAKLVKLDINEATEYFSQAFGSQVVVPDIDQDSGQVKFFGGGDCHVPSTARSGHLRFDVTNPDGKRISLSLFVSPDPGLLPMEEGLIYALDSEACAAAGTRLFAWVRDGIQYLFVSEAPDEMCAQVRGLMQAPTTFGSL